MSFLRKALSSGAVLVTAGAVRRLVTHVVILPVPLSVWLVSGAILWIGYIIVVARDDIVRALEQKKTADRNADLMLAALDVRKPPALHRVK